MNIEEIRKEEKKKFLVDRVKYNLIYPVEEVVRMLKRYCKNPETSTILDFGCGSGRNIRPMLDMGFKKIIATDYNEECLELTRSNLREKKHNVEYLKNNRKQIPLSDNSLDCMVAWGVLFAFTAQERQDFLKEIHRVLKPNGFLIADYRGKRDNLYGRGTEIERNLFLLNSDAGVLENIIFWFCDEKELRNLYESSNFIIDNIERKLQYVNNLSQVVDHYYLVCHKNN